MYKKVPLALIIGIIVAIIIIALLGVGLLIKGRNPKTDDTNLPTDIEPQLELSLSTEEEGQDSVKINGIATTDDVNGVYSITLPDGTINRTDNVEYEVTENGNYTFKATGNNGKSTSLSIEVNNIRVKSSSEAYVPDGFSHVEGDVENRICYRR